MEKLNKLAILPVNKTSVFYSKMDGRDVLVRTGTLNPDSFLHSLLHAYSRDYVLSESKSREKIASKLRSKLDKNLEWDKLNNSVNNIQALTSLENHINDFAAFFYAYVEKSEKNEALENFITDIISKDSDLEVFGIMCELISLSNFKGLLKKSCIPDVSIQDLKEKTLRNFFENVPNVFLEIS